MLKRFSWPASFGWRSALGAAINAASLMRALAPEVLKALEIISGKLTTASKSADKIPQWPQRRVTCPKSNRALARHPFRRSVCAFSRRDADPLGPRMALLNSPSTFVNAP